MLSLSGVAEDALSGESSATPERYLPIVLLDSPINATLAANKAGEWRRRGVGGFLFQGLLDDFSPFPKTSPNRPDRWELLVDEVRLAQRRLQESGIGHNFLRLSLAPEAAWFVDAETAETAFRRFTLAGEICQAAELKGLALEVSPASPVFDTRFPGYPTDVLEEELSLAAHKFAVKAVRTYIRAYPKGEILLLAGELKEPGPLWFSFFSGVFEALGAATDIPVRLVVRRSAGDLTPEDLDRVAQAVEKMIAAHFDLENRSRWEKQGGLVLALEPIALEGPLPEGRYSVERFRLLRNRALLRSSRYCVAYAPKGGWWALPTDQVAQYGALRQSGPAKVTFAPPVPAPLDGFRFQTPFDDCRHAGVLPFENTDADVLANGRGAALLAWRGLHKPLTVSTRQALISVTDLTTEVRTDIAPTEGSVVIPPTDTPVLIEGLPVREYAIPAAFRLEIDPALRPGPQRANFLFSIGNATKDPLWGLFKAVAPPDFSIGAASFPVKILPGERAEFGRVLQGVGTLGASHEFTLSIMAPDMPPISRRHTWTVEPTPAWRQATAGPVIGSVGLSLPEDVDHSRIFYVSAGGNVGSVDPDGASLWRHRLPGRMACGPAVIDTPVGPVILVGDTEGNMHLIDADGGDRGGIPLSDPPGEHGIITHRFHPDDKGSFVVVTRKGQVTRLAQVGSPIWVKDTGLSEAQPAQSREGNGRICITGIRQEGPAKGKAEAVILDDSGKELGRYILPGKISAAPVSYLLGDDHHIRSWLVGLNDGTIVELTEPNGDPAVRARFKGGAIRAVACFHPGEEEGSIAFAAVNNSGVAGFDRKGEKRWFYGLSKAVEILALPEDSGWVAGSTTGVVVRLHGDGTLFWKDTHAWDAITGLAALKASRNRMAIFISSADGMVRAVDGGE